MLKFFINCLKFKEEPADIAGAYFAVSLIAFEIVIGYLIYQNIN